MGDVGGGLDRVVSREGSVAVRTVSAVTLRLFVLELAVPPGGCMCVGRCVRVDVRVTVGSVE